MDLVGQKVRLWPKKGRDAFDMFLEGKTGVVESVEIDHEDRTYLAVVLDEDEGRDLGIEKKVGHRFFFDVDEVQKLTRE
jgi:hypothetical protein